MKSKKSQSRRRSAKGLECQGELSLQVLEAALPELPKMISLQTGRELTCRLPQEPKVVLTREAFNQLFGYACSTQLEICCLGSVKREGATFTVERFYLLEQAAGIASTELDEEALADFVSALLQEGRGEEASRIKCWAHSHPKMELFWSKTDDETCRTLLSDYLVSIVVGQSFNARCRIDIGGPVPITLDNVPLSLEFELDEGVLEQYRKEVDEKLVPRMFRWDRRDQLSEHAEQVTLEFGEDVSHYEDWPYLYQDPYLGGSDWG